MTDNEIKKGAKCCLNCDCYNCPYAKKADCERQVERDLFNLIERLEAKIAVLEGWCKKEER